MLLQLSSGLGPRECERAVGLLALALKKEFPDIRVVAERPSCGENCFTSVLLESATDLSSLAGTIEWICRSPFRPNHRRKNWFINASVIADQESVDSGGKIRFERFHCGGHGGQNVNKVETGVRLVHVPSGMAVTCTEERSQIQNRKRAMKKLEKKFEQLSDEGRQRQKESAWSRHTQLVRGNPVRVYEGEDFTRKV